MIGDELRERDCTVGNASGDAGLDVVKMAVETPLQHTTTLIGEDRIPLSYSFTMHRERVTASISDQTSPKLMAVWTCITSIA